MATQIDIANMALTRLGSPPVASLTNLADRNVRLLALQFGPARDEVLQSHRWGVAKKQVTLAEISPAPTVGVWAHAYQMPADFLRFIDINGDDAWDSREWFEIQQNQLLCNYDGVSCSYIFKQEAYHLYPGALVDALAMVLASRIAAPITGNPELAIGLRREADRALSRAMTLDTKETGSNENSPLIKAMRSSHLVASRRRTYFLSR